MLEGVFQLHPFEKLRPHVEGDLFTDLSRRLLYSTSASSNSVTPMAVLAPRKAADVAAVVTFCKEHGIPLTPRGAGTGMSGANVGPGVVIDFVRFLRNIPQLDASSGRVRVQPGVLYGDLNRFLGPHGLFLPPDPSSGAYCTVGGMVANNAAGAHTVKYGATRDFVLSLEGVDTMGEKRNFSIVDRKAIAENPQWTRLQSILAQYRESIASEYPKVTKNASGYLLQQVLRDEGALDLPKLLCGSEGTLALFTEIEMRVIRKPSRRALLFASFASLEDAGQAVLAIRALGPSALEILDRSLIRAILETKLSFAGGLSPTTEAALLIEFDGESDRAIRKNIALASEVLRPSAASLIEGWEHTEQDRLWDLRRGAAVKARREDWKKPIRVIEDVAVPVERVPEYIRGAREILAQRGVEAILVGHAGNGNIHVEPLLDVRDPGLKDNIAFLAQNIAELAHNLGGTLSGEHGDGIVRSAYLPKMLPALMPAFAAIKELFDPCELFNPGVILSGRSARTLAGELRYGFQPVATNTALDSLHFEIERCFSCGLCRSYCPGYADSGREETLPRAKAALLRGLVKGEIARNELFSSAIAKETFESCRDCQRCLIDCPAGFDAGMLAREAGELL